MNAVEVLSRFNVGSKEYIFFEKIFEKIGANFIRKSVEQDVKEAHSKLNKAMQKYFEVHILANAIMKSVEQLDHNYEVSSDKVNPFYFNLVRKYLPPGETNSEFKLFGLSQKNVLKILKDQEKLELDYAAFKKRIEDNINDFCMKLVKCTTGVVFTNGNWKNAFDVTMKDLEYKAVSVLNEEAKESQSKRQLKDMIKTYYEELTKGVLLLSKLLSLHVQKLEFESDIGEFHLQRCHAVYLKIRVFELKILEATYNGETMPALKKISRHLDQTEEKLKVEQTEKSVALESYLKLGEEYEKFVDEYAQLTKSIREQKWAIDELKSQKQHENN